MAIFFYIPSAVFYILRVPPWFFSVHPFCGVGNKLRDSCKETRFYFRTQLFRFLVCLRHFCFGAFSNLLFVFQKMRNWNKQKSGDAQFESFCSYAFSTQGLGGRARPNFLGTKESHPTLFPPIFCPLIFFFGLTLAVRRREGADLAPTAGWKRSKRWAELLVAFVCCEHVHYF